MFGPDVWVVEKARLFLRGRTRTLRARSVKRSNMGTRPPEAAGVAFVPEQFDCTGGPGQSARLPDRRASQLALSVQVEGIHDSGRVAAVNWISEEASDELADISG